MLSFVKKIDKSFNKDVLKLDQRWLDSDLKDLKHHDTGTYMYFLKESKFVGYIKYKEETLYVKVDWIVAPKHGKDVMNFFIDWCRRPIQLFVTLDKGSKGVKLNLFMSLNFKVHAMKWKDKYEVHLELWRFRP